MSQLYLEHFGLSKPPFKITPDLDFFFAGGRRGDVLSALLHVAASEEGIITVVAEVGSGKTLLSRLMISRLDPQICTVYLANPVFSRDEILSAIARDLGLHDLGSSTESKLAALQGELLRRHGLGQRVLLVVDEAHAMPPESLEEIRLLSNLETAEHKLVNIMLFGQPELDTLLAQPRLRQVRDRVIHRFELQALPHTEACAYVDHRLRAAGWRGGALFHPNALAILVKASGGRARRINLLADKALLGAYAQGLQQVGPAQVKDAVGELHGDLAPAAPQAPTHRVGDWRWWASALGMGLVLAAAALWWGRSQGGSAHFAEPAAAAPAVAAPLAAAPAITATVQAEPPQAAPPPMPASAPALAAPHASSVPPPQAPASAVSAPASAQRGLSTGVAQALEPHLLRLEQRLQAPVVEGYTVQLASLPRDEGVANYINKLVQLVDSAMVFAQLSTYNGRAFVSVFYGQYANAAEATRALAALPEPLKANKPMLRTWAKIKQDQSP